ncbi:MAG: prolyl oligopeptidase family serine peptidase [Bacillota bacterium]
MAIIEISEVLDLKYLEEWSWAPAGRRLAYLLDDGGKCDVWMTDVETGRSSRISEAEANAGSFSWHPSGERLAYIQDGNLWVAELDGEKWCAKALTQTAEEEQCPCYSPDGNSLSFIRGGALWIHDVRREVTRSYRPGGDCTVLFGVFGAEQAVQWSPRGDMLLAHFREPDRSVHLAVLSADCSLLWRSCWREGRVAGLHWTGDGEVLFLRSRERNTVLDFCLASLPDDAIRRQEELAGENRTSAPSTIPAEVKVVYQQVARGRPGPLRVQGAYPEPGSGRILFISEDDGWAHLYLYCRESKSMKQMTFGECEDFGYMGCDPAWSPGGRYVVYSSNRGCSGQRQLWILDADESCSRQLTALPGTNAAPKWSPDGSTLAFLHCDHHRSADIWTIPVNPAEAVPPVTEGPTACRLTHTMPESWTPDKCIVPEEVVFEGVGGWDIHGYLIAPPEAADGRARHPGLVWVHGGPIRQMRYGFHPMRSYALFYAYSQYLAHRGYVSLLLNFRGGIGYGREFRNGIYRKMAVDDVADVVAAGRYLKNLPGVDEERVGVWGLSYGGYMTLTALTKYPEEFRMGINIAGIWDFAQWITWVRERHGQALGSGFEIYFDGSPEESPELYRIGSPCSFRENLKRPLINLHGTADANVDFEQMDCIVKDCLELGCEYEAYYYPDEAHTFTHRHTWADAFAKIERELERHLKA